LSQNKAPCGALPKRGVLSEWVIESDSLHDNGDSLVSNLEQKPQALPHSGVRQRDKAMAIT
jgi:hypothetical protein